ncbi:hypothetical protein [Tianweitania sediminis]|uniref:Uncharacterized protein n=1 Tax=Tianweitania sediminis TaxID=1502156 RepID=A0A8J7R2B0_9HYPH|nr:hypothetical protein [Tianweitania sediminis]MBP0439558.1 hypothetical protein [Tianweitania sediminis]
MAANLNDAVRQYVNSQRGAPLSVRAAANAISRELPERVITRQELAAMIEEEALVRRIPLEADAVH